ncbi:tubby C-terminal domain-like protein [Shouchella shacheensis]|uniref:tubby C-terminal domain-like protein n=1 Tax=Shouchella shacheensis TaxID=1649580 RepID=UPI0007401A33|nr:hypothetical protein [Shouchella shacheensis]
MSKLILLFIAGFIGLFLRFIFLGEFELEQLMLLILFPVGSILVYVIMKWQYDKDKAFEPGLNEEYYVTHLGDRVSSTFKQMYNGKVHIGTYQRFYNKWWKRVVADTMKSPGIWYLNLKFSFSNGDNVVFKGVEERKIHRDPEWLIYRNGEKIGFVRTRVEYKNKEILNKNLYLEYKENTYHYQASMIGSQTQIYKNELHMATADRLHGAIYELKTNNNYDEEHLLFMGYILFNYLFGK